MRAGAIDDADRAERSGVAAAGGPKLPQEGDDRGLAARARNGGHDIGLARIKPGRRMGERGANVRNDDQRQIAGGGVLRDDDDGAPRLRIGDESQPVGLVAGDGEECKAFTHRAAVGRNPRDLEIADARTRQGARQKLAQSHQCPPPCGAGAFTKP